MDVRLVPVVGEIFFYFMPSMQHLTYAFGHRKPASVADSTSPQPSSEAVELDASEAMLSTAVATKEVPAPVTVSSVPAPVPAPVSNNTGSILSAITTATAGAVPAVTPAASEAGSPQPAPAVTISAGAVSTHRDAEPSTPRLGSPIPLQQGDASLFSPTQKRDRPSSMSVVAVDSISVQLTYFCFSLSPPSTPQKKARSGSQQSSPYTPSSTRSWGSRPENPASVVQATTRLPAFVSDIDPGL